MIPINLPDLLPFFDNWERVGSGRFMASCPMPNHRDSDPSVSVTQDADTGKIMMYCWGCTTKAPELVQALGLRVADLFGDPGHPAAVRQIDQTETASPEDRAALELRIKSAVDNLYLAKDYILTRFNLSVEQGKTLGLGVDEGFGAPHLLIPFYDPTEQIVGMQGRRLSDGEPRWRSVSGPGWSKIGCINWSGNERGPVIITEGPSDALAVAGHTNLPTLAVRGASNTAPAVCEQIKQWLEGRTALVIGDNGEAGEKFAQGISEGTGIPRWILPSGYGDVCDYLDGGGGSLQEAVLLATTVAPVQPEQSPQELSHALQARILDDIDGAIYDEELKAELLLLPSWQVKEICEGVAAQAGRGQVTHIQRRAATLKQAVDAARPDDHGGNGGGPHATGGDINSNDLPEIIWNIEDQLHLTEFVVREAMNRYDGSEFYRSAIGQYVKIVSDDIVNLKDAGVKSMLGQMGRWRVINGQREVGHVPFDAARMVCDPSWECGLPTIQRRVEVPFMQSDGAIVSTPGFYEDSGVYLLPRFNDPIAVPEVPAIVTDEHVREARRIFEDATEGFVFKDQASKTNLIGMTLTSPLRELFHQNPMVPLLTSTAPQSGSGKGTSVRVPLSTCGIGPYSLATTAYNSDENEFEKKLVGKLLKKSTYIFLDNIRGTVNSAVLEQMLTAANYDGRTLGFSEVNALSTLALWVSTLQSTGCFNRDLTRRCVPVELIKNYKGAWIHKNIDSYLADKRGELIWACFVVARKWLQDGAPVSHARLDGYTGWTEVIGGMLEHILNYEDFLGNLESFQKAQNEAGMTIDGVLERWLTLYSEDAHPARMAVEDYEDPALHQMLGLHSNPSTRQVLNALTRVLDSQRGHIVGNSHIWTPLGPQPYGHEGQLKLYHCMQLPTEEE